MLTRVKNWGKKLGPGLITGASDDDPSGIATYSQAGAGFGLSLLWTALITYPLMFCVQEMCGRIGVVSGKSLAGIIKMHYSKFFSYLLLVAIFPAISFNIAADFAGMGAVANLLVPSCPRLLFICLFTLIILAGIIFCSYTKFSQVLKWLSLSLILYIIVPFLVKQDWKAVGLASFIPTIEWNKHFLEILVAILGTTISPYLFFWQNSMSIEEKNHSNKSQKKEMTDMQVDVNAGMLLSNLIMFFIILTTGSVLYPNGVTDIQTVEEAAKALEPLVGKFAYLLFALGVIGTGLLAIPVLGGCLGYIFADIFDWAKGMDHKFHEARLFYVVISFSIILGAFLNVFELNPIQSLIYTSVIYGVLSPFLILLILHICNSKGIMGNFKNHILSNLIGGFTFLLMSLSAIAYLYILFPTFS